MKLLLRLLVILAVALTPACLEMEEEISLEKKGNGTYRMTVDMGQMMEMLSSFMGEGEDPTAETFAQMDSAIRESVKQLREMEGISNVSSQSEGYRFTVQYDFRSIDDLNDANANSDLTGAGTPFGDEATGPNYSLVKRTFERQSVPIDDLLGDLEDEEGSLEMVKMFMADAVYKQVYHLPGKVKSVTNDKSEISEDGKTVTTEIPLLDWMEGTADVGNKIKFKKR
jgi:hypothetical protein